MSAWFVGSKWWLHAYVGMNTFGLYIYIYIYIVIDIDIDIDIDICI
jgi:hypothetical protein